MGLLTYLQAWKARSQFPKKKENFWYCGEIHDYKYELMKAGKPHKTKDMGLPCEKFIINPYSDVGGKVPDEGDIIPCIRLNGWIGYYLVVKKWSWSSRGSDFAMWDDGYEVNMKFHHCEKEAMAVQGMDFSVI